MKCELNEFNKDNKKIIGLSIINEIENGLMKKIILSIADDKKDIL